jgi:glycosyltransferase involved in cell wall biosynthesis
MELIVKELGPPTICLNMIVKEESHIIEETLKMLCSKITFTYWVICDTGSNDNTCEIITKFFNLAGIPGELHKHEWKNLKNLLKQAV